MGIISFITRILNIALLVAVDVFAFAAGTFYGVAALIGSAAFFIAYMVSVEVTVAPVVRCDEEEAEVRVGLRGCHRSVLVFGDCRDIRVGRFDVLERHPDIIGV